MNAYRAYLSQVLSTFLRPKCQSILLKNQYRPIKTKRQPNHNNFDELNEALTSKLNEIQLPDYTTNTKFSFKGRSNNGDKPPKSNKSLNKQYRAEELKTVLKSKELSNTESIKLLNKKNKILISLDLELYERKQHLITEVGLSIYNPTYQKTSRFPHILNFHFIPIETRNKINKKFVPNNKLKNITGSSIFGDFKDLEASLNLIFDAVSDFNDNELIIVGHDVSSDVVSLLSKFKIDSLSGLSKNGNSVCSATNIASKNGNGNGTASLKTIDTVKLWKSLPNLNNPKSSLPYILNKLSIPHSYLHNAANDSYYTLLVCLTLSSTEFRKSLFLKNRSNDKEESDFSVVNVDDDADSDDFDSDNVDSEDIYSDNIASHEIRFSPSDESIKKKTPSRNALNLKASDFFFPCVIHNAEISKKIKDLTERN